MLCNTIKGRNTIRENYLLAKKECRKELEIAKINLKNNQINTSLNKTKAAWSIINKVKKPNSKMPCQHQIVIQQTTAINIL